MTTAHDRLEGLSWLGLNSLVYELDEEQLLALLRAEREGHARQGYLNRIYTRYSRLRRERERKEIGI